MWFIKNSFLNECWGLIWTIQIWILKGEAIFKRRCVTPPTESKMEWISGVFGENFISHDLWLLAAAAAVHKSKQQPGKSSGQLRWEIEWGMVRRSEKMNCHL